MQVKNGNRFTPIPLFFHMFHRYRTAPLPHYPVVQDEGPGAMGHTHND